MMDQKPKPGLPEQGAKAILDAFADANEEMLKQGRKRERERREREKTNQKIRDFVNDK